MTQPREPNTLRREAAEIFRELGIEWPPSMSTFEHILWGFIAGLVLGMMVGVGG